MVMKVLNQIPQRLGFGIDH
jgi:hypothetical protein